MAFVGDLLVKKVDMEGAQLGQTLILAFQEHPDGVEIKSAQIVCILHLIFGQSQFVCRIILGALAVFTVAYGVLTYRAVICTAEEVA